MASGYYPIVLIPNLHQSVVGDGFRIYEGTTRQNPPHPPQIPRILKWEEAWARRLRNKSGLLGLLLGSLLILTCFFFWHQGILLSASIALVLMAFGVIGVGWGVKEAAIEEKRLYRERVAVYERKQQLWQRGCVCSPRRRGRRNRKPKNVTLPLAVSSAQKGVSETFFFEHLQAVFGSYAEIHFGQELEIEESDYNYSTDFSLIVEDAGLYLDIEIDECYVGKGKKFVPTHCVDDERDQRRDRFFLDRGWIVIRFAEEQVVRHPQACCQEIAQVLSDLTGDRPFLENYRSPVLPSIRQWTKADARRRFKSNFRKRLLAEIGVYFS